MALVATIRMLFDLRPSLKVIIAGTIRNVETFETFRHACCEFYKHTASKKEAATDHRIVRNHFNIEEIPFEPKSIHEQKALFYAKAVPFKILSITAPNEE